MIDEADGVADDFATPHRAPRWRPARPSSAGRGPRPRAAIPKKTPQCAPVRVDSRCHPVHRHRSLPAVRAAAQRDGDRPAVELDGRLRRRRRAARPGRDAASVSAATVGRWRRDRRIHGPDPQLDPVVELERRRPCAGPGWPAAARGRRPRRRSSGVSCVSRTTTRPSCSATAVPGRGVAWISTSSGASVTPASVTDPSGSNSNVAAPGGRHDRRDRRPEALPDLGQQRLDPSLDERRVVVDDGRPP